MIYSRDTLIGRFRHNILLDLDDTFVFFGDERLKELMNLQTFILKKIFEKERVKLKCYSKMVNQKCVLQTYWQISFMSADSAKTSIKFIDKVLRRTEIKYIWQDHSLKKSKKAVKF